MTDSVNPLLQAAINTKEVKTEMVPAPEGIFAGEMFDYDIKTFEAKEPGKPDSHQLVAIFNVTNPKVAQYCDRDVVRTRANIWLNLDDDGSLSANNVGLGRMLEACEAKDLGEVNLQEALDSCKGVGVALVIGHRVWEESTFDEIKAIKPAEYLEEVGETDIDELIELQKEEA